MLCPKFGAENDDNATFCRECSATLKNKRPKKDHTKLKIVVISVVATIIIIFAAILIFEEYASTTYENENFTVDYPAVGIVENPTKTNYTNFYDQDGYLMGSISDNNNNPDLQNLSYDDWIVMDENTTLISASNTTLYGYPAINMTLQSKLDNTNKTFYTFNYNDKTVCILLNNDNPKSHQLIDTLKVK